MVSSVGSMPGLSSAGFSAMRQALFQKSDADGSGGLSLEEFKANGPKGANAPSGAPSVEDIFSEIDTDSDGSLTESELDAHAQQMFSQRMSMGGMVSGENMMQLNGENREQAFLDSADTDGDGVLSVDEFAAAKPEDAPEDGPTSEEIFAQLDTDGDGSLTTAELEAGHGSGGPGGAGGPPPAGGGSQASSSSSDEDEESYDSRDTNKDGVVSASERLAASSGGGKIDVNALISQTLQTLLSAQEQQAA